VFVGIMFWIVPVVSAQTAKLARKIPDITKQVRHGIAGFATEMRQKYGLRVIPEELLEFAHPLPPAPEPATPEKSQAPPAPAPPPATEKAAATPDASTAATTPARLQTPEEVFRNLGTGEWLNKALPRIFQAVWSFFTNSLGGFLGVFGFLLSLIIVPLYL